VDRKPVSVRVFTLILIGLITLCVISVQPIKAVSRTIIVPDDYPTINSAIGNATAGDTILVKNGTYEEGETLEIDKTLTLIGEDAANTIIKLHPPYNITWILTESYFTLSNAITIKVNNVKLSNLTITIAAPGGHIATIGDGTQIVGSKIDTGGSSYILVTGSQCNITDNISGASISLSGFHNIVARNSVSSIDVDGDFNVISNNTGFVNGVRLSNANSNVICGNNISTTSGDYGVCIVEKSSHNMIYDNDLLALNSDVRINSDSAENNTLFHNNFLRQYGGTELASFSTYGLALVNFWDNGEEGNYWADYNGTDANRDGIGDTPYVIDGANVDNYPLMFPFDTKNNTVVLPPTEPFLTIIAATAAMTIAVVVVALFVYFRKRKR
jgi:nitrous oxidase accessory protein NosD